MWMRSCGGLPTCSSAMSAGMMPSSILAAMDRQATAASCRVHSSSSDVGCEAMKRSRRLTASADV